MKASPRLPRRSRPSRNVRLRRRPRRETEQAPRPDRLPLSGQERGALRRCFQPPRRRTPGLYRRPRPARWARVRLVIDVLEGATAMIVLSGLGAALARLARTDVHAASREALERGAQ